MSTRDSAPLDVVIHLNADNLTQALRTCIDQYNRLFEEYVSTEFAARRIDRPVAEESDAPYQLRREAFEYFMSTIQDSETHHLLERILGAVEHQSDPIVQPDLFILPRLPTVRLALGSLHISGITAQLNFLEEQISAFQDLQNLIENSQLEISRLIAIISELIGLRRDERAPARSIDIAALPKIIVDESMLGGDSLTCMICLHDLQLLDEVTKLPCNHMAWHSDCIALWIGQHGHTRCPYCRGEITRE